MIKLKRILVSLLASLVMVQSAPSKSVAASWPYMPNIDIWSSAAAPTRKNDTSNAINHGQNNEIIDHRYESESKLFRDNYLDKVNYRNKYDNYKNRTGGRRNSKGECLQLAEQLIIGKISS